MKKYLKYGICSAAIIASALIGDALEITDNIYYPLRYRNIPVRKGTYEDPFSIRKRYIVREGFLEVQVGNESTYEYYPVMEGLRVNEREMHEQFIDTAGDVINSLSRRTNRFIDKVKKTYDGFRKRR